MTKEREQLIRYRREISFILKIVDQDVLHNKFNTIKDYFCKKTLKEISDRNPFEGLYE